MKWKSASLLGLAGLLAACGQNGETNETTPATETPGNMAGDMANMGNMGVPAEGAAKIAKGTGTVTAVDQAGGTITLDHGPILEANWPAMTMAFKAQPQVLAGVKVGDKIAFELALKNGAGEVTAIRKQ